MFIFCSILLLAATEEKSLKEVKELDFSLEEILANLQEEEKEQSVKKEEKTGD